MATEKELLKQLEQRIAKEYKDTEAVIRDKIAYFTKDFDKDNKSYQKMVKDGKMTKTDYQRWYKNQMFTQKWCKKMVGEISQDITNTNVTASKIVNNDVSDVFFYGCLEASKDMEGLFNFEVIDAQQIKEIGKRNKEFLPNSTVDVPKDKKWNERRIQSSLMQSAIKGESVSKLAGRLRSVVGMNRNSAIRNARTMMTASHNMGKLETGREAVNMGINLKKVWIATEDGRTRTTHREVDGTMVGIEEPFEVGGSELMYPADPDGEPKEVYNCRCTLGFEVGDPDELREGKFNMVDGEDITDTWERRPDEFDFEIEDVINAQGFDGVPRVVDSDEFDKYVKESNIIATRGYKAPDQETLDAYRDQLYNGKWYVDCSTGGAMFGRGMYTAGNRSTFLSEESIRVGQSYGNALFGNVETLTFDKSIKTINSKDIYYERQKIPYEYFSKKIKDEGITLSDVQKDMARMRFGDTNANPWDKYSPEEMKEAHNSLKGLFEKYAEDAFAYMDSFSRDDGVFCALRGYDAIEVDVDSKGNKYFVVLNRTKVIFRRNG